jgi:hypothetical protein
MFQASTKKGAISSPPSSEAIQDSPRGEECDAGPSPKPKATVQASQQTQDVLLDVRGELFQIKRKHLCKEPESHFAKVFGGALKIPVPTRNGAAIIDRDPKFFPLVKAYLEGRSLQLPSSMEELAELEKELRYYGLSKFLSEVSEHRRVAGNTFCPFRAPVSYVPSAFNCCQLSSNRCVTASACPTTAFPTPVAALIAALKITLRPPLPSSASPSWELKCVGPMNPVRVGEAGFELLVAGMGR